MKKLIYHNMYMIIPLILLVLLPCLVSCGNLENIYQHQLHLEKIKQFEQTQFEQQNIILHANNTFSNDSNTNYNFSSSFHQPFLSNSLLVAHLNEYLSPLSKQTQQTVYQHLTTLSNTLSISSFISSSSSISRVETLWFNQRLDHFNLFETRTFSQRIYRNLHFSAHTSDPPIFLYIGGESDLYNSSLASGEIVEMARLHNASLYAIEHRYYGKSQPFDDLKTENLQWLTSEQALADIQYLIQNITNFEFSSKSSEQSTQTTPNPLIKSPKIITFGGSYPGSLSAYFRLKYPHLTIGSLASSAPILAKINYYEYDQAISSAVNEECSEAIRDVTLAVQNDLFKDTITAMEIKRQFNCELIDDNIGFLYVLADAISYAVQYTSSNQQSTHYGLKDTLCDIMTNRTLHPIDQYINFINYLFSKLNTTCLDFSTVVNNLNDTTILGSSNKRQWYYQSCTEFGYFQIAPKKHSLRSTLIDLNYHLNLCKQVFGKKLIPQTSFINGQYGGNHPSGSRILFPNGSFDPWRLLSLNTYIDNGDGLIPLLINGTSHCADLHSSNYDDLPSLIAARLFIAATISQWLSDDRICPEQLTNCNGHCVDLLNDPINCGQCAVKVENEQMCRHGIPISVVKQTIIGNELLIISAGMIVIGVCVLFMGIAAVKRATNSLHGLDRMRSIQHSLTQPLRAEQTSQTTLL